MVTIVGTPFRDPVYPPFFIMGLRGDCQSSETIPVPL